jgi:hypothetical protein
METLDAGGVNPTDAILSDAAQGVNDFAPWVVTERLCCWPIPWLTAFFRGTIGH